MDSFFVSEDISSSLASFRSRLWERYSNPKDSPLSPSYCRIGQIPSCLLPSYSKEVFYYVDIQTPQVKIHGDLYLKMYSSDERSRHINFFKVIKFIVEKYSIQKENVFVHYDSNGFCYLQISMSSFSIHRLVYGCKSLYKSLSDIIVGSIPKDLLKMVDVEFCEYLDSINPLLGYWRNSACLNVIRSETLFRNNLIKGKCVVDNFEKFNSCYLCAEGSVGYFQAKSFCLSYLAHFFSEILARRVYSTPREGTFNDFKKIKVCTIVRNILSTTSWRDKDELNLLSAIVKEYGLSSFRELCARLSITSTDMRAADAAFMYSKHSKYYVPSCAELHSVFGIDCRSDCGVTTPLALPYNINIYREGSISYELGDNMLTANVFDYGQCKKIDVSTVLTTLRIFNDSQGERRGVLFCFFDQAGVYRLLPIFLSDVSKEGFCDSLREKGVSIPNDRVSENLLRTYVYDQYSFWFNFGSPAELVDRAGWYNDDYVFPDRWTKLNDEAHALYPPSVNQIPVLSPDMGIDNPYGCFGGVQLWRSNIGEQTLQVLFEVIGIALLPAFLKVFGLPTYAFHFHGGSVEQRRTLVQVMSSVWGGKTFTRNFRENVKNLGPLVALHNDGLICFGEILSKDSKAYSGVLRRIFASGETDFNYRTSRHIIISAGENRLEGGRQLEKYLPNIINYAIPENFPELSEIDCFDSYGVLGVTAVSLAVWQSRHEGLWLTSRSGVNPPNLRDSVVANSQQDERSLLFSIVCSVLQFLADYGYFPNFSEDDFYHSFFKDNYAKWQNENSKVERDALAVVYDHIGKIGKLRIDGIDTLSPIEDIDGYQYVVKKGRKSTHVCLILTRKFDSLFCERISKKKLAELLKNKGLLIPDTNGSLSTAKWLPGQRKSVRGFVLNIEKFGVK